MSAFLVSPEHIAELASFVYRDDPVIYNIYNKTRISFSSPSVIATILAKANIASLEAKYKTEDADSWFHGDVDYVSTCCAMSCEAPHVSDPRSIYNMVKCFDYQACEVDSYISTDAYWIVEKIKDKAVQQLLKSIPTDIKTVNWEYRRDA